MLNNDQLGTRIRTLRRAKRLTLEALAGRCGITRSMISKIENGRAMPSVSTLTNLAAALGATVATVLEDRGGGERRVFTPAALTAERTASPEKGYAFFPFATTRTDKAMQPFLFSARRGQVLRRPLAHNGEEWLFVLKGRMRYFVGRETFVLGPGDSLYYDATEQHDLEPLSAMVEYLAIFAGLEATGHS
jgi:transcriptional regulator with XRE-family HTH domain